jgi:hypothetical protein
MAQPQYPKVKGSIVAWANIVIPLVPLDGQEFKTNAFAAIDWDDSLEQSKVPGTGPKHIGRAIGAYDANASMTMYLDEALEFQKALKAIATGQGFHGIGEVEFDIPVSWEPLNGQGRIFTVKILGARFAGRSMKNAPGANAAALEIPLSVSEVIPVAADGTELPLV